MQTHKNQKRQQSICQIISVLGECYVRIRTVKTSFSTGYSTLCIYYEKHLDNLLELVSLQFEIAKHYEICSVLRIRT